MNPWLIFIIGTSCSGKSSFIRAINTDDYICLDDAKPLYRKPADFWCVRMINKVNLTNKMHNFPCKYPVFMNSGMGN
jgi:ABC-type polar amino acid transport system ATPase subunit